MNKYHIRQAYIPPYCKTVTEEPKHLPYLGSEPVNCGMSEELFRLIVEDPHPVCYRDSNGQRHYFSEAILKEQS
jgi:hypothetical protein